MPFFEERKNNREGRGSDRSSFVSKSRIEMIRKNQGRMKVKEKEKEKVVSCRMRCSVDFLLPFSFGTSARRSLPPLPAGLRSSRSNRSIPDEQWRLEKEVISGEQRR